MKLNSPTNQARFRYITFPLFALILVCAPSCTKQTNNSVKETETIAKVSVIQPEVRALADVIEATGTLSPSSTIKLVARVQGELLGIGFKEGELVTKGQTLFKIEPNTYIEQVKLFQAQLDAADSEYKRQKAMLAENATSVARVENWLAKREEASAQLALAKIQLGYTTITAPATGRIGQRSVDPGNIIGPAQTPPEGLAKISILDPLYLDFDLSEPDIIRLRQVYQDEVWPDALIGNTEIKIALADDERFSISGIIDYIESGISGSTGTSHLRAVVQNTDEQLIPGLFARIRIPIGNQSDKILVPDRALGADQQGYFLKTIGKDGTLTRTSIQKGALFENLRAVEGDITADTVIVSGNIGTARFGDSVEAVWKEQTKEL